MNLNQMNQELSANTILSHYRIVRKLGAGGMGEVWLAEDTRLDRQVALKLLPAEFTQDAERVRRFMQEAKAASALNHPNIITVYDIGESEAGRFIVMELVAGRTLRSVIADHRSGPGGDVPTKMHEVARRPVTKGFVILRVSSGIGFSSSQSYEPGARKEPR